MDAHDLRTHLGWCRKMAASRKYPDLDRDDVFSIALVAAWKSAGCPDAARIIPLRNLTFRRDILDLRRHVWSRKRSPSRCRRFYRDEQGELESLPDRSLDDPLDILCARETVAPLVQFQERYGHPPAPPCIRCGTLGGLVRGDGTIPRRTMGLCHNCYQKEWTDRRRRPQGIGHPS